MFTLTQIQDSHARVKSGADFPQYIRDLIELGVQKYTVYVVDGHSEYIGTDTHVVSDTEYSVLEINPRVDLEKFKHSLKIHQQGKTDYFTFCKDAAEAGICRWTVDTFAKTCTYYDELSNLIIEENIPI